METKLSIGSTGYAPSVRKQPDNKRVDSQTHSDTPEAAPGTQHDTDTHGSWGLGFGGLLKLLFTIGAVTGVGAQPNALLPDTKALIETPSDVVQALGRTGTLTEYIGMGAWSGRSTDPIELVDDHGAAAARILDGLLDVPEGNTTITVYRYVPESESTRKSEGKHGDLVRKSWSSPQDVPLTPGSTLLGQLPQDRMFLLSTASTFPIYSILTNAKEEMLVCVLAREPTADSFVVVVPNTTQARAVLERARCEEPTDHSAFMIPAVLGAFAFAAGLACCAHLMGPGRHLVISVVTPFSDTARNAITGMNQGLLRATQTFEATIATLQEWARGGVHRYQRVGADIPPVGHQDTPVLGDAPGVPESTDASPAEQSV